MAGVRSSIRRGGALTVVVTVSLTGWTGSWVAAQALDPTTTTTSPAPDGHPVAVADSYTTRGTLTVAAPGLLLNDVLGDESSVQGSYGAANGAVVIDGGGGFTYTPVPGFVGVDTFRYFIATGDPTGQYLIYSDVATVTITVLAPEPPHTTTPIPPPDTSTAPGATSARAPAPARSAAAAAAGATPVPGAPSYTG
ncbi:MAG TPA: Ig-like domain-containing protein [Aquihabitans sp.]|jgi:hypothetical protein|nr:Ig-like domain-containing protein [Aquihabitans sp.]